MPQLTGNGGTGGSDPGGTGGSDPGGTGGGPPGGSGGSDPGGTGGSDPGGTGGGPPGGMGANYSSGAGSAAPKIVTTLGPTVIKHQWLHFRIQRQQQAEWCWAAVAASVERFFDKDSELEQCQVANKVFNQRKNRCCKDPSAYDVPEELEVALQKIHKWRNTLRGPLTFEQVQEEIDRGRPVCVRIQWLSGGGHFVVVRGYRLLSSGAQQLYVADPENPSNLVDYNEFKVAYYGEGTWAETDFVASDWS
jgi:hypothetical protein